MCGIAVTQQGFWLVGGGGKGGGQPCRTGQEQERNRVGCGMERGGRTVYNKVDLSNLGEMTREG